MEIHHADIELHVEADGDPAAPPILLLHGITSSVRTWDWLVPHLVDRYRVLRLDFRGHGRSGRFAGGYDAAGYVADAAEVCRQVAGGPAVVIGHSLGGGTAAALAQRHPELVQAVVLEDPPLGARRSADDGHVLIDSFRLLREAIPRLQSQGVDVATLSAIVAASPSSAGRPLGELLHPDALDATAAGWLELDAAVLDPVLAGEITPAYEPTAPIPVPVLLMAADPALPDAVARPDDVDQLRRVSPHAEIVVMEGCGHLIHDSVSHRDRFLRVVLDFLDRVAGCGR